MDVSKLTLVRTSSVVIASIVRLALLIEFDMKGTANLTEDLLLPWFSTVVEIGVAIIGFCLPCLLPLYRRFRYGSPDSRPTNGYDYASAGSRGAAAAKGPHAKLSSGNHRSFAGQDDAGPFERLPTTNTSASRDGTFDPSSVHNYHAKATVGPVVRTQHVGSDDDIPLEGINVYREITVKSSHGRDTWIDDSKP